ncbi:hypothetical protein RGU72_06055 [Undibacterium sp. 5I1]|uniref:hypothetical protein n=1 Tax=unclassified Undibacterium TaxID=2630295 RepID=UPI002AB53CC2|nr:MULTISPECIES: hypothetical protein [unclassified Undibacterium]MDY7537817.1 hypothetical protein [Undibacterium sp. 5I1]MEB0229934.1 hypothetical protein [Undibacterium sp. 10I3]MEB0257601.1 hypothetical protein [Undibacterium sp. 5I1]
MIAYVLGCIKAINDAVRDKYFLTWFIPLVVVTITITAGLFELFGFDKTFKIANLSITHCCNLTDTEALSMILCIFISTFSCILVIGELINFAENRRKNRPIHLREFIFSIFLSTVSVLITYILAHRWCH